MKAKRYCYCIFYKSRGKWVGPINDTFFTRSDIIAESGFYKDQVSFKEHIKGYLKTYRTWVHKPVQLRKMVFKKIKF